MSAIVKHLGIVPGCSGYIWHLGDFFGKEQAVFGPRIPSFPLVSRSPLHGYYSKSIVAIYLLKSVSNNQVEVGCQTIPLRIAQGLYWYEGYPCLAGRPRLFITFHTDLTEQVSKKNRLWGDRQCKRPL